MGPLRMSVSALVRFLSRMGATSASAACPTSTALPEGPLDWPSHEDFGWIATGILTVTCIITGLGIEVVLGDVLMLKLQEDDFNVFWKFSQLLFPLFLTVSLLAHTVFGLPFLVFGLWKLGCPETTTYARIALQQTHPAFERLVAAINGLGTLLHHSISAWSVCCLVTGKIQLDDDFLALTLPLVVEHWFVLLKYWNKGVYVGTTLAVEFVWQWEILYHFFGLDHPTNWKFIMVTMFTAHWFYILGFCLETLEKRILKPKYEDTPGIEMQGVECAPAIAYRTTVGRMMAQHKRSKQLLEEDMQRESTQSSMKPGSSMEVSTVREP